MAEGQRHPAAAWFVQWLRLLLDSIAQLLDALAVAGPRTPITTPATPPSTPAGSPAAAPCGRAANAAWRRPTGPAAAAPAHLLAAETDSVLPTDAAPHDDVVRLRHSALGAAWALAPRARPGVAASSPARARAPRARPPPACLLPTVA